VVKGTGLENRRRRTSLVGSNPAPAAESLSPWHIHLAPNYQLSAEVLESLGPARLSDLEGDVRRDYGRI
jgi:hypothetical protein